jgi:hypothetical protein
VTEEIGKQVKRGRQGKTWSTKSNRGADEKRKVKENRGSWRNRGSGVKYEEQEKKFGGGD